MLSRLGNAGEISGAYQSTLVVIFAFGDRPFCDVIFPYRFCTQIPESVQQENTRNPALRCQVQTGPAPRTPLAPSGPILVCEPCPCAIYRDS